MKALFFLRHYNDIDHITPVISKWIETGHSCDIVLIGKHGLLRDYRIEFLSKLDGVRIAHIQDLIPALEFLRWRLQTMLLSASLQRLFIGPLVRAAIRFYDAEWREAVWRTTADRILQRSFREGNKGVVVFDWVTKNSPICIEWIEKVVSSAHTMGLGTVSLPHGDSPHSTQLIRHGEWDLAPDASFSAARIFDKLVVPNELCARRFRPFLDDQFIAVLGSPRYCDEWLAKLAKFAPASPLDRSDGRFKIVIFLRKSNFTIFWEEVAEVVCLIAAFPNTVLVIKPHTRGGWRQSLTGNAAIRRLRNVSIAADDIHSIHLMNWADVIIDLATSVVFEAVKARKPVLAADYLHAGRSALAHYMPETELKCRDDVYRKIKGFVSGSDCVFYVEQHRQRFINEMLHPAGPDVLPLYVSLLETQARTGTQPGPGYHSSNDFSMDTQTDQCLSNQV
ncbi:MAG TPA: hypothetical protein VHB01_07615 [Nitrosospira sp.]|nr:hypothetical protein [Nitrosospira sp.]